MTATPANLILITVPELPTAPERYLQLRCDPDVSLLLSQSIGLHPLITQTNVRAIWLKVLKRYGPEHSYPH